MTSISQSYLLSSEPQIEDDKNLLFDYYHNPKAFRRELDQLILMQDIQEIKRILLNLLKLVQDISEQQIEYQVSQQPMSGEAHQITPEMHLTQLHDLLCNNKKYHRILSLIKYLISQQEISVSYFITKGNLSLIETQFMSTFFEQETNNLESSDKSNELNPYLQQQSGQKRQFWVACLQIVAFINLGSYTQKRETLPPLIDLFHDHIQVYLELFSNEFLGEVSLIIVQFLFSLRSWEPLDQLISTCLRFNLFNQVQLKKIKIIQSCVKQAIYKLGQLNSETSLHSENLLIVEKDRLVNHKQSNQNTHQITNELDLDEKERSMNAQNQLSEKALKEISSNISKWGVSQKIKEADRHLLSFISSSQLTNKSDFLKAQKYYEDLHNSSSTENKSDNYNKINIKIGFILKELCQISIKKKEQFLNKQEVLSAVNQDNVIDIIELLRGMLEQTKKISSQRILIFYSIIDSFMAHSPQIIEEGLIIQKLHQTIFKKYVYKKGYENFKGFNKSLIKQIENVQKGEGTYKSFQLQEQDFLQKLTIFFYYFTFELINFKQVLASSEHCKEELNGKQEANSKLHKNWVDEFEPNEEDELNEDNSKTKTDQKINLEKQQLIKEDRKLFTDLYKSFIKVTCMLDSLDKQHEAFQQVSQKVQCKLLKEEIFSSIFGLILAIPALKSNYSLQIQQNKIMEVVNSSFSLKSTTGGSDCIYVYNQLSLEQQQSSENWKIIFLEVNLKSSFFQDFKKTIDALFRLCLIKCEKDQLEAQIEKSQSLKSEGKKDFQAVSSNQVLQIVKNYYLRSQVCFAFMYYERSLDMVVQAWNLAMQSKLHMLESIPKVLLDKNMIFISFICLYQNQAYYEAYVMTQFLAIDSVQLYNLQWLCLQNDTEQLFPEYLIPYLFELKVINTIILNQNQKANFINIEQSLNNPFNPVQIERMKAPELFEGNHPDRKKTIANTIRFKFIRYLYSLFNEN